MWFLLFCVVAGIVYATLLYFRDRRFKDQAIWKVLLLSLLRFLSVFGISLLLLGPLMRISKEEIKNPTVVIIQDASESVKGEDADVSTLQEVNNELSKDFQVDTYHFAETIKEGLTDTLDGESTNISKVLSFLDETYANQNLGAIIMSSDGIFNEGQSPIYHQNNLTAPFFIVAQGDTTQKKDILLQQVYHNKISYLNDKFIVQADIQAYNFNNTNTNVAIYKLSNGKRELIERQPVQIKQEKFFSTYSFEVPANEVGVIRYQVEVSARNGEFSTENNIQNIYVDILDARQKILIYADSPHPDVAAMKNIITTNKNYEVSVKLAKEDIAITGEYDLVIFHNLPSKKHRIVSQLSSVNSNNTPRLFIAGTQIDIPSFNSAQNVVNIRANSENTNNVQAYLTNGFKLYEQSEELKNLIKKMPPLTSVFGEFKIDPNASILLKQKIGDIETDYPLLAFRSQSGQREAVLTAEGVWQWRLYDFLQNNSFEIINELMTKPVQYLTIKEDKRKFRVSASSNLYKTYDRIKLDAELYNDSYEKINEPDAFLVLKNQDGDQFDYTFSKVSDYYQIDAGTLPAGNYTFTGTTSYNGSALKSSGKFSIKEVRLEQVNTTANHSVLRGLTERYGGQLFHKSSDTDIVDFIRSNNEMKPIVYSSSKTESALNLKWILFLLLGLLFTEWFVRRLLGNY